MERILNYILYIFIASLIAITIYNLPKTPLKYKQITEIKSPTTHETPLPTFVDETITQGIFKPHMQSSDILSGIHESFGAGACVFDYNNDGWMDLFLINGSGQRRYFGKKEWWQSSTPFTLYKNTGLNSFEDVTDTALGKNIRGWGMGCAAADLDNDGDQDLLISNYGTNLLLKNNADGTFTDSTERANIKGKDWSTSILTADFNNDGLLDIYILNFIRYQQGLKTYEASSGYAAGKNKQFDARLFDSSPNQLYINKGNLVFEDLTKSSGLGNSSGKGLSAEALDINDDGHIDIFISNGQGGPNKLFINNGNLSFSDASETFKIATIQQTTGTKRADLDNDGQFDLFVGTDNKNSKLLYKKTRNALFLDMAKSSGLDSAETSGAMSWGVALSDLNNDGNTDIFLANGFTTPDLLSPRKPQGQPNILLLNTQTDFKNCNASCYSGSSNDSDSSRSVVPADFDNDGDTDLYISQNNALGQLLINTTEKKNWLGVKLIGKRVNTDALGSVVTLKTQNKTIVKAITNSGFLCSHDKRIIFHFGNETIDSLIITWPNGTKTRISNPPTNRYISILEDDASFTQYHTSSPAAKQSRINFSKPAYKIEVIKWLIARKYLETANSEANLLIDAHPSSRSLKQLIEVSNLLNPQTALKAYLAALKSDDTRLRLVAIEKIKQAEEEIASRFLLDLFADPSPHVRCEVARSYRHFFQEEEAMIHSKNLAIPLLIHALEDKDDAVKICAINALAESENHRAMYPLMRLISSMDKNNTARTRAINALGRLREKKSADFLSAILHDAKEPAKNRYTAMSALKRLNVIQEDKFLKKTLNAYYNKGEILDFLNLLQGLYNDPEHNIIINPSSINNSLRKFSLEKQQLLNADEASLIKRIISTSHNASKATRSDVQSTGRKNSPLPLQTIRAMQKVLSNPSAGIEARTKILHDERILRLFSTRKLVMHISGNKNDPLRYAALVFLIENATTAKELSDYKKQLLEEHYDEAYRFSIAKGLFKKAPDIVINSVLTKKSTYEK